MSVYVCLLLCVSHACSIWRIQFILFSDSVPLTLAVPPPFTLVLSGLWFCLSACLVFLFSKVKKCYCSAFDHLRLPLGQMWKSSVCMCVSTCVYMICITQRFEHMLKAMLAEWASLSNDVCLSAVGVMAVKIWVLMAKCKSLQGLSCSS